MTKVAKHMRVQMSTDKNTDKSILISFQPKNVKLLKYDGIFIRMLQTISEL
jgi:hypothetical protein